MVQRRAARFVKGRYGMFESVTQMLEQLTWTPLSKRRENSRLILFYKIINNLAVVPHSCLEKADVRTRKKHSQKFRHIGYNIDPYGQSFFPNCISAWNSLAKDIAEANTDDITITSTHTSMSAARKYIQPYLHKVYDWTQHNNLIINPDKTTCTLFTPDPAEYNSNLGLNINNKALPMALHPKVLGLTLDPKLTYNAHIQNIATHAQKPLQVIKALTGTTWGKQKETLVATYKAVMRPTLEYASSIWSPMASPTSINKLQVMQNAALRACTGCTHDTNIQHLHDETNILPIQKHLQLQASQIRQKAQYPLL